MLGTIAFLFARCYIPGSVTRDDRVHGAGDPARRELRAQLRHLERGLRHPRDAHVQAAVGRHYALQPPRHDIQGRNGIMFRTQCHFLVHSTCIFAFLGRSLINFTTSSR